MDSHRSLGVQPTYSSQLSAPSSPLSGAAQSSPAVPQTAPTRAPSARDCPGLAASRDPSLAPAASSSTSPGPAAVPDMSAHVCTCGRCSIPPRATHPALPGAGTDTEHGGTGDSDTWPGSTAGPRLQPAIAHPPASAASGGRRLNRSEPGTRRAPAGCDTTRKPSVRGDFSPIPSPAGPCLALGWGCALPPQRTPLSPGSPPAPALLCPPFQGSSPGQLLPRQAQLLSGSRVHGAGTAPAPGLRRRQGPSPGTLQAPSPSSGTGTALLLQHHCSPARLQSNPRSNKQPPSDSLDYLLLPTCQMTH